MTPFACLQSQSAVRERKPRNSIDQRWSMIFLHKQDVTEMPLLKLSHYSNDSFSKNLYPYKLWSAGSPNRVNQEGGSGKYEKKKRVGGWIIVRPRISNLPPSPTNDTKAYHERRLLEISLYTHLPNRLDPFPTPKGRVRRSPKPLRPFGYLLQRRTVGFFEEPVKERSSKEHYQRSIETWVSRLFKTKEGPPCILTSQHWLPFPRLGLISKSMTRSDESDLQKVNEVKRSFEQRKLKLKLILKSEVRRVDRF